MGNQTTTGQGAAELTVREASLPAKFRDWREKPSVKAKQVGLISNCECFAQ